MERAAVAACTISLIGGFKIWNMRNYGGQYVGREQVIRQESIQMEEKYELPSVRQSLSDQLIEQFYEYFQDQNGMRVTLKGSMGKRKKFGVGCGGEITQSMQRASP